ncbi:diacylglycerol/lipid kinase family protein [Lactobacillus sp. PSON]|uniref:diacylglycerol/lipid kinase family protein n=1 Tax=Lactobacillus sp. PSON TaxID=3455454 RepID=UPI004041CC07
MSIKITILVNKIAGNGNAKIVLNETINILKIKNISYTVMASTYPGELIPLAKNYANEHHSEQEYLLVIGGDGSFNQVLNGIKNSHNSNTPIAYIPAGTGNDFARAAKLSSNPQKVINHLSTHPKIELVDCGKFTTNHNNWQYFVNNFGIGFDAYIVHKSNGSPFKKIFNKIGLGKLVYVSYLISALHNQDNFKISIQTSSKKHQFNNTYFVTTTNHPYFGGGIPILPSANIHNHTLNAVVVEKPSLRKFIILFIHLLKDRSHINDPHFHNIEAKKIHITTYNPEYGQIDGEDTKKQSFQITFQIDHFNIIR